MNRVTELLGCTYPVIQGAMGVICNPELVAAVSNAGGYGLLATAFEQDVPAFRDRVRATRALTDRPFGANLHAMNPLVMEFAGVLTEEGVKAVTVSGGSPRELIPFFHDRGVKVITVVPSVEVAVKSEAAGVDAIVAEGSESGGMQGFKSVGTMVLVPAVVDAVKVPVIAAGGIGDSRGYRAALALGAEGVQVGTRFIATRECIAHEKYKEAVLASSDTGTGLVNMGRFLLRALRTELVERVLQGQPADAKTFTPRAVEESWLRGDLEAGILPAGQVAGLIHGIPTVKEIFDEMVSE